MLGVFQDLSYAEMEEITGTKAVTLRSRMFHGLKRLARTIGVGEERMIPTCPEHRSAWPRLRLEAFDDLVPG